MALKALMLKRKIDAKNKELASVRAKIAELETREADLEVAIAEAETEEERTAVEEEVEAFESDKSNAEEESYNLSREVEELENELAELEAAEPAEEPAVDAEPQNEERKDNKRMNTRTKFFGMTTEQRDAFIENESVKGFLERMRTFKGQTRAVTGADLTIPTEMLELVREQIAENSKLYKHVNVQSVSGKSRQTVMGTIPEAVWTEACASVSELTFGFNGVEVDGYKVGGFIPVCNAILEDNDVELASALISALGKAIGLGLDKAILYGTGTKMPLGIMSRLAQATKPEAYPTAARPWVNLSTTNVTSIATTKTGVDLFKEIVAASGKAKSDYSVGSKFWAMNESTKAALVAEALSINAAGAIATGISNEMPVIGGAIETLSFIPDNVIIGGYGDLYLLAERAGAKVESSDQVKFIEDQTVFKGTARYDGLPVIAEGFVAIGIKAAKPDATMTFAGN